MNSSNQFETIETFLEVVTVLGNEIMISIPETTDKPQWNKYIGQCLPASQHLINNLNDLYRDEIELSIAQVFIRDGAGFIQHHYVVEIQFLNSTFYADCTYPQFFVDAHDTVLITTPQTFHDYYEEKIEL